MVCAPMVSYIWHKLIYSSNTFIGKIAINIESKINNRVQEAQKYRNILIFKLEIKPAPFRRRGQNANTYITLQSIKYMRI